MAADLQELKQQLLALPAEDRHDIAVSLWDSLEGEHSAAHEFSHEHLAEFERRSEEVRSGKVETIPWEDVKKELEALP